MPKINPTNANFLTLDGDRFSVPAEWEAPWFPNAESPYFVPLNWKRGLLVPDDMGLEAWYLWDRNIPHEDLTEGLLSLLSSDRQEDSSTDESDAARDRRAVLYPADLKQHGQRQEQWRVGCRGLLRELAEGSGPHRGKKILVHREASSLSVWTLRAFQTHFSRVPL